MAKSSSIENNKKRADLIESKKEKRLTLKTQLKNRTLSLIDRVALVHRLAEVPRNSSKVRFRNRCLLTGRARGYYRRFKMSRIALRELASSAMLPGVTKASW